MSARALRAASEVAAEVRRRRAAEVPKAVSWARAHAERPVGDGGDVALAVGEERGGGGRAAGEGGRGRGTAKYKTPPTTSEKKKEMRPYRHAARPLMARSSPPRAISHCWPSLRSVASRLRTRPHRICSSSACARVPRKRVDQHVRVSPAPTGPPASGVVTSRSDSWRRGT